MGITIVQKSDLARPKKGGARALILAGGAVTGGSFKAGGLLALSDYFDGFRINDFDIFVGISSGSLIAAPLVGGISPESILKSLDGTSRHFSPLSAWHYYRPNASELVFRPLAYAAKVAAMLPGRLLALAGKYPDWSIGLMRRAFAFLENPTVENYEKLISPVMKGLGSEDFPSIMEAIPSGLFDNSSIESYIRKNIERNGLTNDFRETFKLSGKRLYICAVKLDGAKTVVFGPDEDRSLTISEAIQASTALPGFYRPARINGVDYVDGGVQRTASLDIAAEKGAKLIVCYNPFRPYEPEHFVDDFRSNRQKGLSSGGILAVLNQIFRAFFHSRLTAAIDHFRKDPSFDGDIILIEPNASDRAFFALNPLLLRNRVEAARIGYWSVRDSIDEKFGEMKKIMAAHGIGMQRSRVEDKFRIISRDDTTVGDIQTLLEGRRPGRKAPGKGRSRVRRAVTRVKKRVAKRRKR